MKTHHVVTWGFAGSAAVVVAVACAGWWSTQSLHAADVELQATQRTSLRVNAAVRSMTDVILTGGSKSAREALEGSLKEFEEGLVVEPPADPKQHELLRSIATHLVAMGKIAKPSPDDDRSMIAYGKLGSLSDAALASLRESVETKEANAKRQVALMSLLLPGIALFSMFLVFLCAQTAIRRLNRSLGAELEATQALMKRVGEGNLTTVTMPPGARSDSMIGSLHSMVEQMRQSVRQVQSTATTIQGTSAEIASGSSDLNQRTELNASSLQQTASAVGALTATVAQTADSAATAMNLAKSASDLASKGGDMVSQMEQTMQAIQTSSNKITDIVSTIDGIAFQTNILALNAAVEAARSGEAGRGFAVVAMEVRNLAKRAAASALEIKQLIATSGECVDNGARQASAASATMSEVVNGVQSVCDVISGISVAVAQQRESLVQINHSVTELDQVTQQNAAQVEHSASSALELQEQAVTLSNAVSAFRLEQAAVAA